MSPPTPVTPHSPRLITDAEYGALRAELNFWQNVRLTIVGFDFAFVGGVLASDGLSKNPWVAAFVIVAALIGSLLFAWFAARSSICIGAYLELFAEVLPNRPGWETRLGAAKLFPYTSFRSLLAVVFVVLLGLAFLPALRVLFTPAVPPADHDAPPSSPWFDPVWGWVTVGMTGLFVVLLGLFVWRTGGYRKTFTARWSDVAGRTG